MKNALKLFAVIALIGFTMAVLSLTSCGGDDGVTTVSVTGVTLDQTSVSLTVGGSVGLTATVAPSNATNKNVTWSSSDTAIATVNDGEVTAVATGTATITVTTADGGKTATCSVTVTNGASSNVAVTGVTLNKNTLSLNINGSETLIATVAPDNATNKNVTWLSSNNAIATVNDGNVTAVAAGTATITVTTADGNKTADCTVTVNTATVSVTGISLNKSSTTIIAGGTETLTAIFTPDNATNKNVTWLSSNTNIATVNNGTVTAVAAGSATITVTTADGNKTATCNVTVSATAVAVTGVSLNKSSTSITAGGTETLIATITPSGATNQNVNWSSSNTAVATVNGGTVTAVSAGTATITVSTADGNKTATCSVTVTLPNLSGNITIFPNTNVTTGMILFASYSGTEAVSYQWKKDGVNVGTSSTTKPNSFTPTTAGNYTVTVSATGYNDKTSATVNVTALASGYEVMFYGVANTSALNYLKGTSTQPLPWTTLFREPTSGNTSTTQSTINKSTPKTVALLGNGFGFVMLPASFGEPSRINDGNGSNVKDGFTKSNATLNGVSYFLYEWGSSQSVDYNLTVVY